MRVISKILLGLFIFGIFSGALVIGFSEKEYRASEYTKNVKTHQPMKKAVVSLEDTTGFISHDEAEKKLDEIIGEGVNFKATLLDDRYNKKIYWSFDNPKEGISAKVDATNGELIQYYNERLRKSEGSEVSNANNAIEIAESYVTNIDKGLSGKDYFVDAKFYNRQDAGKEWIVTFQGTSNGVPVLPNRIKVHIGADNGKVFAYSNYWSVVNPEILDRVKIKKEEVTNMQKRDNLPKTAELVIVYKSISEDDFGPVWKLLYPDSRIYPNGTEIVWIDAENGKTVLESGML